MNLRRLFGLDSEPDFDPVESRVQYPSERTCPEPVLRDLRTIDPQAELLYVGAGAWLLGIVCFHWERTESAAATMRKMEKTAERIHLYESTDADGCTQAEQERRLRENSQRRAMMRLYCQGFRPIARYQKNDPDTALVHDFQIRDWLYRFQPEASFNTAAEWAEGIPQALARIAQLQDAARTKGLDAMRHVRRGAGATVTNLGLTGVA